MIKPSTGVGGAVAIAVLGVLRVWGPAETGIGTAPSWHAVALGNVGFSAMLPRDTPVTEERLKVADGVELLTYTAEVTTPHFCVLWRCQSTWTVMALEYPPAIVEARTEDEALDGGVAGSVSQVGGELLSVEKMSIDGAPARRAVIRAGGTTVEQIYVLVGGARLLMAQVATDAPSALWGNRSEFFGSIHVVPNKR
jgi:hypothetical protein